jgi:ABC-type multidrug transport system fused ATPase/permease subunit
LIFSVLIAFLEFSCVLIIKEYIDYFQTPDQRRFSLFTLGLAFIFSRTLSTFLYRQLNILEIFLAYKSALELTCFIFNKVLKASPSSFGQKSTQGEIVNFIQVDAPRLAYAISLSPKLLISPVLIVIYIYLLFNFFGISFLSGMFLLIIFMLISYRVHSKYRILENENLEKKDKRMKVTTETFDTIKLLKLYNWENEFMDRILEARDQEMVVGKSILNNTTFSIVAYWSAPIMAAIVTIGCYQYMNSSIIIGNILIGLTIFNMLQPLIRELPISINSILETIVSIGRIEVKNITDFFIIFKFIFLIILEIYKTR